jgi:hypothetical protein
MRELEFLPEWYGMIRRRKRRVAIESWTLVVLLCSFGVWIGLTRRSVAASAATVASLNGDLDHVHGDQRDLDNLLVFQRELQSREQMIASLGFPVQVTRVLQMIDSVMPKEMSLEEFTCDTSETPRAVTSVAGVAPGTDKSKPLMDRRLDVRIKAVAPGDIDLGNFIVGLQSKYSFLSQVTPVSANDRVESGHRMREFVVSFSLNLNQQ